MGAYLGVQQGSMFPPQFVHLHYKPENPTGDVVKVTSHFFSLKDLHLVITIDTVKDPNQLICELFPFYPIS